MEAESCKSSGTQPPPDRGHPMPRRAVPEKSVTLQNHRLARESSQALSSRASPRSSESALSRRNSSGDSHETTQSDPKTWFDKSNQNPAASKAMNTMDIDPPFFQKENNSSNEDLRDLDVPAKLPAYSYGPAARSVPFLRTAATQSSSADDYRSVIDDLTIENKRLREELKRLKRFGADNLSEEKLFEIRVHGLPQKKKRELEATLRDFAASLEGSTDDSSQRKKPSRLTKSFRHSGDSKHASSSSSHSRPVDSAYASMSTGTGSNAAASALSLNQPPSLSRAKSSEQKVQTYLQDIPEGLYPHASVLSDKERKKIVVRRLEQLFTGKIMGRTFPRNQSLGSMSISTQNAALPTVPAKRHEAAREAQIEPEAETTQKRKARSGDNVSASNSHGGQTESGGNEQGSGSGSGHGSGREVPSPPTVPPPEQRPTRPRDLDPDRVQIPSENMDYIRHLGIVPPELLPSSDLPQPDVAPDADGWVYLNLLCNLAQLHIVNVTPAFIRSAVSGMSTKFQLSPDGRKIRWRGGVEGTKFSSDSSGDSSNKSPSTDDTDGSNESGQRKKAKMRGPDVATTNSGKSSKNQSKFGPSGSGSADDFHYKPLFLHQNSSIETSLDGTGSSAMAEDSNNAVSSWNQSSGSSPKRKQRRNGGAIVYYSGAPFCTDLSRDPGETSPSTYVTSSNRPSISADELGGRPVVDRTASGSSLPFRPLSDGPHKFDEGCDETMDAVPDLIMDDLDSPALDDVDFPWCEEPQAVHVKPLEPLLEPCGLGGVIPEDHFAVVVITRRPIGNNVAETQAIRDPSAKTTASIARQLSSTSLSPPVRAGSKRKRKHDTTFEIEYMVGRIRRLKPIALPPPTIFFPPFSTDSDSDSDDDEASESASMENTDVKSIEPVVSPGHYPLSFNSYPDDQELSSGDEEDEIGDNDGYEACAAGTGLRKKAARHSVAGSKSRKLRRRPGGDAHPDSSAATAGEPGSGPESN